MALRIKRMGFLRRNLGHLLETSTARPMGRLRQAERLRQSTLEFLTPGDTGTLRIDWAHTHHRSPQRLSARGHLDALIDHEARREGELVVHAHMLESVPPPSWRVLGLAG